MPRRAFLEQLGRTAPAVLCAGAVLPLAGCAGIPYARGRRVGDGIRVEEEAFGEDDLLLLEHPGENRPILLRRTGPDSYTAVSTRCTHRGCQVQPQGPRLACPCHGSEYDPVGRVLEGPARRDLRRFPVRVADGALFIELSRSP